MKRFKYDIFTSAGVYITTWSDVASEPSFSSAVNGGLAELNVNLARNADAFGESDDVAFMNQVIVRAFDDNHDGSVIFNGFISGYTPALDADKELIQVSVLGYVQELARTELIDNGAGINFPNYLATYTKVSPSNMTSNSLPSPFIALASSEYASYPAWKAFDGIVSGGTSCWYSNLTNTGWIQLYFGTVAKKIRKYSIIANNDTQGPRNFTLQGSNDGSAWTVVDTQTNQTSWGGAWLKREFVVENELSFKYWRINVTLNNGDAGIGIEEIEFFEQDSYTRIGSTKLKYLSKDPSNILKDLIDKYRAVVGAGAKVSYTGPSIDLTGTSVSYTFNTTTILDAIKKVLELSPEGWYWYLDESNVLHFHAFPTTPDYTLYVKKDISKITPNKRIENVKNVVYVTGGEVNGVPLYKVIKNNTSIAAYGRSVEFVTDQRVTLDATASLMGQSVIDRNDAPEVRTQVTVIDNNNADGKGMDIELLKPGKVINILNFLSKKTYSLWGDFIWGQDKWGYDISNVTATNVNIIKISYKPDLIDLEVSSELPTVSHRIEDIQRNLQEQATANNPSSPS
jgi:hypothetical protein